MVLKTVHMVMMNSSVFWQSLNALKTAYVYISNVQDSIVYHGDSCAMANGNVQEEWKRGIAREQLARECLSAKIQAFVYLPRACVILCQIVNQTMMKTFAQ